MFKSIGAIHLSILFLILANIIWGASFPIYKWSLENVPPFTFSFIRFFGGAIIIFPFVIKALKIAREDIPKLILVSVVSVTIQIPLLFLGLQLSPSINAPIIISSGPIFLIIASMFFLQERLRLKVLLGTLIGLGGTMLIILRPVIEAGFSGSLMGNLFIFLATLCGVGQAIILKKLTVRNNPLTLTFWMFLIGSLPIIPFVLWEGRDFNVLHDINLQGGVGLIYGIVLASVLAHWFLAYGIKYIKASEVGIFSYVDPIATIIVAVPLLNEAITPTYTLAAILVFLGIFVAEGRLHYHPLQKLFNYR